MNNVILSQEELDNINKDIRDFYSTNNSLRIDVDYHVIDNWLSVWNKVKYPIYTKLGNNLKYSFDIEYIASTEEDALNTFITKATAQITHYMSFVQVVTRYFSGYLTLHEALYSNITHDFKKIRIIKNGKKTEMKVMRFISLLLEAFVVGDNLKEVRKELFINIDKFYNELLQNNKETKETVVISIDPIDYIQASYNTSGGWRSCFAPDGEYHVSTNSFMRTEGIAILYILDRKGKKKFRQWVVLGEDFFSKGRSYPDVSSLRNKAITKHLKSLYKQGNFFSFHKNRQVLLEGDGVYLDSYNTWFYKDNEPSRIYCEDGETYEGYIPDNDGFFQDGNPYCDCCGERFPEEDLTYSEYHGYYICDRCLADYRWCEDIGDYVDCDQCVYIDKGDYYLQEDNSAIIWCYNEEINIDSEHTEFVECYSSGEYATLDFARDYWFYCEDIGEYVRDKSYCYLSEVDGLYYYDIDEMPTEEEEEEV